MSETQEPQEPAASQSESQAAGAVAAPSNTALAALCAIARFHQISADPATLAHQMGIASTDSVTTADLLGAAKHLGLKAKLSRSSIDRLGLVPLPALALMHTDDGSLRVVILAQSDGKRVLFQDLAKSAVPGASAGPTIESTEVFATQWTGELILVTSRASLAGSLAKFDFTWFIPSLIKYRKLLGEVLLISFMLQLFALVSPLFFQVVMDKVLVHKGMTTLDVLVIGLVIVVVFESVLNALRAYVFSHTTSRIDVELGARLFRHLIQLPLSYFQARRVGDSIARVRELENIRSFLTGNAMTVLLDVVFSVVFIAVMLFYSVPLTLIVLVSLPLYFGLSLAVVPILRARLDVKFARSAENQSMLVETVTGIQTVKATALEPSFAKRWDTQLAAYVSASFKTQNLASVAHEGVNLIGKLVNAATLWYGAHLVMENELSVGQFVAFNMFAGRVSQPIMRMAQLWTDFQQTGISVARLGDILNTRTEVPPSSTAQLPALKGRITLDKVVFRYRAETQRQLADRYAQASTKRIQLSADSSKATQREKQTQLISPVDGTVQQLAIHTTGGVVTSAQQLMVVVPDSTLVTAEVAIANQDIGFVNASQAAEIKLETFSFTKYGTVKATVDNVSADAVTDEKRGSFYPAILTLEKKDMLIDGKQIPISPGMNVTAEIKTGKRRIIEFLLSPVQKMGNESLRER